MMEIKDNYSRDLTMIPRASGGRIRRGKAQEQLKSLESLGEEPVSPISLVITTHSSLWTSLPLLHTCSLLANRRVHSPFAYTTQIAAHRPSVGFAHYQTSKAMNMIVLSKDLGRPTSLYSALGQETSIRILTLYPGAGDDAIVTALAVVDMEEHLATYDALSYTGGTEPQT